MHVCVLLINNIIYNAIIIPLESTTEFDQAMNPFNTGLYNLCITH